MTHDLLIQLEEYGQQLDAGASPLSYAPSVAVSRPQRLRTRPWVVVVGAAVITFVLIGAVGWLVYEGGAEPAAAPYVPLVPETWATWTAEDGLVSDCLCQMAMSDDGSIWVVGFDGISRFDGTQWERIQPPRPFTGEGWPAVAIATDGSVWVSGMDYIASYVNGTWGPVIEAGYGMDEGDPLAFQGLEIDDMGRVWTNLADEDGVIENGVFVPTEMREQSPENGFDPRDGVGILATSPDGSIWMGIGDSISGVDGTLIEFDGERHTAYDLGGVREAAFETDGTGWFMVNEVGSDAWMFGLEQWSDPGLYRLDNGDWYRITTEDGLPGYRLGAMILAPDGALWISTADGTVTRYQPGSQPQAGSSVDIESWAFTDADWPPPMYPTPTTADF